MPKNAQTAPKNPIFRFWSNLGCEGLFIALGMLFEKRHTLWGRRLGPAASQGAPGYCHNDIDKFVLLHFLVPTLDEHLEVFLDSD